MLATNNYDVVGPPDTQGALGGALVVFAEVIGSGAAVRVILLEVIINVSGLSVMSTTVFI